MAILQVSDFASGRYKIPVKTNQDANLTATINTVESAYLPRLFGVELYGLFIADLSVGTPQIPSDPRFTKIFDPFIDQTDDCFTQSEGIKIMLQGFVYYLYVRDIVSRVTTDGTKVTTGENSDNVSAINHDVTSRYNDAIRSYQAIQNYMCVVDEDTYPEYEGVYEPFNHIY
jgi:hypothetical protein